MSQMLERLQKDYVMHETHAFLFIFRIIFLKVLTSSMCIYPILAEWGLPRKIY